MGRHDLRPLHLHRLATQWLKVEPKYTQKNIAPWYDVVGRIPPSETLVRTQPIQHRQAGRRPKTRKPSKLFQPQQITYEEDRLRKEFFSDHPWELARPRMVIEDGKKVEQEEDWSQIRRPDQAFNGENVVQRQIYLQQEQPAMTKASAYDQARKEFYEHRMMEDVERRVAHEEALYTGAQFGPSALDIGMQLENEEYDRWREWAGKEADLIQQKQASMYTGTETGAVAEGDLVEDLDALEEGASEGDGPNSGAAPSTEQRTIP